ncbi:hypothetical protein [Vibrio crassostreae]|uniref:hypothetical protein n=1 Tax=Vibrio crassostreae TaxID=246167 RepID=UPI001B313A1E|nr:hypothetical protein [Vibrio crassostreae]
MTDVIKKVDFAPYDLDIMMVFDGEPHDEQIAAFVDYLITARPSKDEAVTKGYHFFNVKLKEIRGYLSTELLTDFISIEDVF